MMKQVNVGNRKLAITYMGKGQPTVVLESGLGDDASTWANLQPEIAAFTQACAYSRAGLGESDPADGPRDIQNVIADLDALLADESMEGPFVLVGHSIGGLIVNMYAHQNPQHVAGMVLVDSSHPNQEEALSQAVPAELNAATAARFQNDPPESWFSLATVKQGETLHVQPGSLGEMPIVVLAADSTLVNEQETEWVKENIWSDYDETIAKAEKEAFRSLQEQHAQLSSNTQLIEVEGSSHYIQIDKPEAVLTAIWRVIEAVRTGKPLVQPKG